LSQSDERVAGRRGGLPSSFGRPEPEPEEVEVPELPGGLQVRDGRLVLPIQAELVINATVGQAWYDQMRELTRLAVIDGTRDAVDDLKAGADADEQEEPGT
jgi:hypothetical protein